MEIVKRISDLMTANRITGVELGRILGLSKSPLTDWRNKKSKPTLEQVVKICEYFSISSDYLLFGKEPTHPMSPFTDVEMKALNYYSRLSEENQDYILGQMIALYKEQTKANE